MQVKSRSLLLTVALLTLISFPFVEKLHAQLDPTFGTNGMATVDTGISDLPIASFVLPDEKILIVSRNECCSTPNKLFFIRFNGDGTLDSTYGTNGIINVVIPFNNPNNGKIIGATRQSDGRIILTGEDNNNTGLITRFNEDGTLDTSFAGGGVHRPNISQFGDEVLYKTLIQPDGKILVVGGASFGGHYPSLSFLRYNQNGSLDTTFDTDGMVTHNSIIYPFSQGGADYFYLQSNDKIIVGTLRESINTGLDTRGSIRRFNADGSMDNSFTVSFYPGFRELSAVAVQPDDKILVGTKTTKNETLERVHTDNVVTRYNPDGSIDTDFGNSGQTTFDIASFQDDAPLGLQVMPSGQIVVAAYMYARPNRSKYRNGTLALARLSSSGEVNGKFIVDNVGGNDRSFSSVLPDGKLLTVLKRGLDILLVRTVGVPLESYTFRGIPFDFPGGLSAGASPSAYRPSEGKWYNRPNDLGPFGLPDDIPAPSDYIEGFEAEIAFFRPSNGTWYIAGSYWCPTCPSLPPLEIQWGLAGDIPVPQDYDGDGKSDIAVFRPSNGVWYIRNSADNSYTILRWGLEGDKPTPGDFDGDGKYDVAVFRPSNGNWYILRSSDGQAFITHFGSEGDVPVQEDYDGDGITDISVYRPTIGNWYRLNISDGSFLAIQWGLPGDIPVPGDYDDDLKTNIAVWRPSNGYWYILNPDYSSMHSYQWGMEGDKILPGKY